jgi:lysophospholipase L1-like esterase
MTDATRLTRLLAILAIANLMIILSIIIGGCNHNGGSDHGECGRDNDLDDVCFPPEPTCEPGWLLTGDSNMSVPDSWAAQLRETNPLETHIYAFGGLASHWWLPSNSWGANAPYRCHTVFAIGTNDAGLERDWREFAENVEKIIAHLMRTGAATTIEFMLPPRVHDAALIAAGANDRLQDYGSALLDLCDGRYASGELIAEAEAHPDVEVLCVVDLYDLLDERRDFESDGVHFSRHGHATVYRRMLPRREGEYGPFQDVP